MIPTRASIPVSSQVVFFHFPKTGGTSLRAVVDAVARLGVMEVSLRECGAASGWATTFLGSLSL